MTTAESRFGVQESSINITHLIRSLQRLEGNPDCFRRADNDCDRLDCAWRNYCLAEGRGTPASEKNQ